VSFPESHRQIAIAEKEVNIFRLTTGIFPKQFAAGMYCKKIIPLRFMSTDTDLCISNRQKPLSSLFGTSKSGAKAVSGGFSQSFVIVANTRSSNKGQALSPKRKLSKQPTSHR
jgi:hypothetical protein